MESHFARAFAYGRQHPWRIWLLITAFLLALLACSEVAIRAGWSNPYSGVIDAVALDNTGNVWISELREGLKNRGINGQWQAVKTEEPDARRISARALIVDREGKLWLGKDEFGLIARASNGSWERHPIRNINGDILAYALGSDGELWIGTTGGLVKFDRGEQWTNYTGAIEARKRMDDWIRGVAVDRQSRVWVAASDGLGYFDREDKWTTVTATFPALEALAVGADGKIWAATRDSLLLLNDQGRVLASLDELNSPVRFPIHDLKLDDEGQLWVASQDGLIILDPRVAAPPLLTTTLSGIRPFNQVALSGMALLGFALVAAWPAVKPKPLVRRVSAFWLFCLGWILTTSWSMALGFVIATFTEFRLMEQMFLMRSPFQWIGVMAIPGAIWGLIASIAQYGMLRRYYHHAVEWIPASGFGFCCGYLLIRFVPERLLAGLFFGLLLGLTQLVVLRSGGWRALWWLVVNTAAWGLGWTAAFRLFVTDTPTLTVLAMMGGLIGLVVGIFTGPILAWILVERESDRVPQNR